MRCARVYRPRAVQGAHSRQATRAARSRPVRIAAFTLSGAILLFGGCALTPARQEAARAAGFEAVRLTAPPCGWYAMLKQATAPTCHATVVIEGDGHAWARRNRLSRDPTPRHPVGLDIALSLPRAPVAYLARPGQYPHPHGTCEARYWAAARFAPEVVTGAVDAIEDLADRLTDPACPAAKRRITLVGYSGGGTLAALVAPRVSGIDGLITIAANLDHEGWTEYHGVSPLDASLTLWPLPPGLASVPQVHLLGARDRIVPAKMPDRVRAALARAGHPQAVLPEAAHDGPWAPAWRAHVCRAVRSTERTAPAGLACDLGASAEPSHPPVVTGP